MGYAPLTFTPAPVGAVRFAQAEWCDRVEAWLDLVADMTDRDRDIYRAGVKLGRFHLLHVVFDEQPVGCVIWCAEKTFDGFDIVVNLMAADPVPAVDILDATYAAFETLARVTGARCLRCWTTRPGMVRRAKDNGATVRHVIEVFP